MSRRPLVPAHQIIRPSGPELAVDACCDPLQKESWLMGSFCSGQPAFLYGPIPGMNVMAVEYVALVTGLGWLWDRKLLNPIYTDQETVWERARSFREPMSRGSFRRLGPELQEEVSHAFHWLQRVKPTNEIRFWARRQWKWQNPAHIGLAKLRKLKIASSYEAVG